MDDKTNAGRPGSALSDELATPAVPARPDPDRVGDPGERTGPAHWDVAEPAGGGTERRARRRAWLVAGAVIVAAGGGVAAARGAGVFSGPGHPADGSQSPTSTATVTRRPLSSQTQVNATLGYAGNYAVRAQGGGTITWLPGPGQVIRQAQALYQVDNGSPVYLLYGTVPAWRTLSEGLTGADVEQLNHDLVALGYATRSELDWDWDYFSGETVTALEGLQTHLGLTATGTLPLGQAVFLPAAIRVTTVPASLGDPAAGPVLQATSTTQVVTIDLNADQQTEVRDGDQVAITLPDGATTPGKISSVGTVATPSSSGSTITVEVTLASPKAAGGLDQAPVEVTITTASVPSTLVVPVNALLAQPDGGYAVEVTGPGGHHLVPVTPGLFDDADGLVQVTGTTLAVGQHVVVPAT
jgi:multidrug efflux pump subunit AcrA (membrane-fusion protein)